MAIRPNRPVRRFVCDRQRRPPRCLYVRTWICWGRARGRWVGRLAARSNRLTGPCCRSSCTPTRHCVWRNQNGRIMLMTHTTPIESGNHGAAFFFTWWCKPSTPCSRSPSGCALRRAGRRDSVGRWPSTLRRPAPGANSSNRLVPSSAANVLCSVSPIDK